MYTCPRGHASRDADYCDECGTPIGATIGLRPATLDDTQVATALAGAAGDATACPQCGTAKVGRFCEVCGHDFLLSRLAPPGWPQPPATGGDPGGGAAGAETVSFGATPGVDTASFGGAPGVEAASFGSAAANGGAVAAEVPVRAPASVTVNAVEMRRVAPAGAGTVPAGGAIPATADGVPGQWRLTASPDAAYHARMQANAEPGSNPIPFPAYCPERRFVLAGRQALIGRRSRTRGIEPEIDLTGPPADPAVSHTHALLLMQPSGAWSVVDLDSANGTYVNDDPDPIAANLPVLLADGDRIHVGAWTTLTVTAI